jgi:hypothetical protein
MKRPAAICRKSPQLAANGHNVWPLGNLATLVQSGTLRETVQLIQEQAETILDLCAELSTDLEGCRNDPRGNYPQTGS